MSTKKMKLNRNMEVVKYFDERTTHLGSLIKKNGEQMDNLPVPQIENEKNEKTDIEKLNELLNGIELDKQCLDSDIIKNKINDLMNTMYN